MKDTQKSRGERRGGEKGEREERIRYFLLTNSLPKKENVQGWARPKLGVWDSVANS